MAKQINQTGMIDRLSQRHLGNRKSSEALLDLILTDRFLVSMHHC
jgi:hypothetical protein